MQLYLLHSLFAVRSDARMLALQRVVPSPILSPPKKPNQRERQCGFACVPSPVGRQTADPGQRARRCVTTQRMKWAESASQSADRPVVSLFGAKLEMPASGLCVPFRK